MLPDNISAARSPTITQGAIVFPVVTRGRIDPSATRRLSIPYTFRLPSTTDIESRPIRAVPVSCQKLVAASRMNRSSSGPFRFPGITSRLTKGRSGSGVADFAAEFHAGDRRPQIGRIGQRVGFDQNGVRRAGPGQTKAATACRIRDRSEQVQPASGNPNRAAFSAVDFGTSA